MDNGWIKLHRQALDSTVWEPKIWFVWSWCLLKANHESAKIRWNGGDLELKPGQFITGREKALSEMPGITAQKYRTAIDYLKSTSRISVKTTNKFSLITVLNWSKYQDTNQQKKQPSNQPLTNEQPTTNHKQEVKNDKNIYSSSKKQNFKDGDTINLYDGTVAIRRFGEWVDKDTHTQLSRAYYKELP